MPSEDELEEALDREVELDVQAVALDAFVFLVNAENPIDTLSLETIRSIYTAAITHWSELDSGGGNGPEDEIHTYSRNRNSGSQELMEKLVMRGTPMINSPDMMLASMIGPLSAINGDLLGIGYSVYFYAEFIYPSEDVKLLGVDGIIPTSDNIAGSRYPLATEVYAVIRQDTPQEHSAVHLRNWLLTGEGQASISASGYVPLRQ
jgi:phosphate transport system substrate-binding protein